MPLEQLLQSLGDLLHGYTQFGGASLCRLPSRSSWCFEVLTTMIHLREICPAEFDGLPAVLKF